LLVENFLAQLTAAASARFQFEANLPPQANCRAEPIFLFSQPLYNSPPFFPFAPTPRSLSVQPLFAIQCSLLVQDSLGVCFPESVHTFKEFVD
jgi:hypothetical protein